MVDLFATRFNHRLPIYVCPVRNFASAGDCYLFRGLDQVSWLMHFLLFPLWAESSGRPGRIRSVFLIASRWPSQPWFRSQELSHVPPLQPPLRRDLLVQLRSGIRQSSPKYLKPHALLLCRASHAIERLVCSSRRPKIEIVYNLKWERWFQWCFTYGDHGVQVTAPSVTEFRNFLAHLSDVLRLAANTVRGYLLLFIQPSVARGGGAIFLTAFCCQICPGLSLAESRCPHWIPSWDFVVVVRVLQGMVEPGVR